MPSIYSILKPTHFPLRYCLQSLRHAGLEEPAPYSIRGIQRP